MLRWYPSGNMEEGMGRVLLGFDGQRRLVGFEIAGGFVSEVHVVRM